MRTPVVRKRPATPSDLIPRNRCGIAGCLAENATATIEAYPVYTDGMTTVLVTSVPDQVMDYSEGDAIRMVGTHHIYKNFRVYSLEPDN